MGSLSDESLLGLEAPDERRRRIRGCRRRSPLAIARNAAIDVTRVKPIVPLDPELVVSELDLAEPDATPDVPERERIREAVSALPPDQRRSLVLAVYLGKTARDISELDGVPLGTVKTRIRSAMLKLRATLEAQHGL